VLGLLLVILGLQTIFFTFVLELLKLAGTADQCS
jgi:hypothetical protein